eukprot:5020378-Ditylum_brightwellii.AAC.1
MLCKFILSQNLDYNGLTEHNLDTLCGNVTRTIHDTVQHHFEHSKVTMASLCIPVQNYSKLGGMMSLIQGDMVGLIIDTSSDDYG